jgi:hypothetical protein
MTTIVRRATVLILIALLAATTSACFFAIGGCSAEEADQLSRMSHYAGAELVPEGDGLGGCGAAFTTTDDPALVVEHYRSTLEAAGWTIDAPPGDGESDAAVSLSARKSPYGMSVSAELLGEPETNFVIPVNSISPDE